MSNTKGQAEKEEQAEETEKKHLEMEKENQECVVLQRGRNYLKQGMI